jgi:hypothetical protein
VIPRSSGKMNIKGSKENNVTPGWCEAVPRAVYFDRFNLSKRHEVEPRANKEFFVN